MREKKADREMREKKEREHQMVLAGLPLCYVIRDMGCSEEGRDTYYETLPELLDQWMSCYILGSCEAFIRWKDRNYSWEIPLPLVDDHDFELNRYDKPPAEIARLKRECTFWREVSGAV